MPNFTCLEPIEHNGKPYKPGATLTLTGPDAEEHAAALLALGAITPDLGKPAPSGDATGELPADFPGREHLMAAGFRDREAVAAIPAEELAKIKGIGPATLKAIAAELAAE